MIDNTHNPRISPRDLQARRIRWQAGVSHSLARAIAGMQFGEARS
jgi:hypothetical protein